MNEPLIGHLILSDDEPSGGPAHRSRAGLNWEPRGDIAGPLIRQPDDYHRPVPTDEPLPEMTAADVCEFLTLMDSLAVRVWIDGGWAVDIWLSGEPRRHADLDIVVERRDAAAVVEALTARGYAPVGRDDTRPWNFVLGDGRGHEIDFHVIEIDVAGRGVYGPPANDQSWPADALNRTTQFCGRAIAVSSPEFLVASHSGYELKAKDWRDVSALSERFGLPIPPGYERWQSAGAPVSSAQ